MKNAPAIKPFENWYSRTAPNLRAHRAIAPLLDSNLDPGDSILDSALKAAVVLAMAVTLLTCAAFCIPGLVGKQPKATGSAGQPGQAADAGHSIAASAPEASVPAASVPAASARRAQGLPEDHAVGWQSERPYIVSTGDRWSKSAVPGNMHAAQPSPEKAPAPQAARSADPGH